MVAADIGDDRLVHLIAAHPNRPAVNDAAEREHRDFRRAAADIDDHRAGRLGHRQTGADRRRHRLLDQKYPPGAGAFADSWIARRSTGVDPEGTHTTICGVAKLRRLCTLRMKCLIISSVTSKSAMTPSRNGRIAWMFPGVRPSISLASSPTARTCLRPFTVASATTEGSFSTMPRPLT